MTTKLSDLTVKAMEQRCHCSEPAYCEKHGVRFVEIDRPAEVSDLEEVLQAEDMLVWYCEAWEQRRGVSEPCESGSAHDAPDFNCHWRFVPLGEDA